MNERAMYAIEVLRAGESCSPPLYADSYLDGADMREYWMCSESNMALFSSSAEATVAATVNRRAICRERGDFRIVTVTIEENPDE